jgi:hypothetical protein
VDTEKDWGEQPRSICALKVMEHAARIVIDAFREMEQEPLTWVVENGPEFLLGLFY